MEQDGRGQILGSLISQHLPAGIYKKSKSKIR
jgi:hypothetical protein